MAATDNMADGCKQKIIILNLHFVRVNNFTFKKVLQKRCEKANQFPSTFHRRAGYSQKINLKRGNESDVPVFVLTLMFD